MAVDLGEHLDVRPGSSIHGARMKTARNGSSLAFDARSVSNDATCRPNALRRTRTSTSPRWSRSSTIIPAQVPKTGAANARTASSRP